MSSIRPSIFGSLPALLCILGCQSPASAGGGSGSVDSAPRPRGSGSLCSARAAGSESSARLGALPARVAGYCLDPYALVRAYGFGEGAPLSEACERVLGPGCAEEPRHGLDRVLAWRYSDASDPGNAVDVILSRFQDTAGAYAHFTRRVVGEADPAQLAVRPLEVPGLAVLDRERVLGWRGRHALWLRYVSSGQAGEQLLAAAARDLPGLSRELLGALPAEGGLPLSVERLPAEQRLPLGSRLLLGDALGVSGLGVSGRGYYREGDKRWRVLSIVRSDSDSAKDLLGTLQRHPAAKKIKRAPFGALHFTERRLPSEPHVSWVIGQLGSVIYGIGDEATVLPELMPAEREANVKLSLHEKLVKLTRINQR